MQLSVEKYKISQLSNSQWLHNSENIQDME